MVMSPDRPAVRDRAADALISEQHVQLARMLGQAKGKISERAMYYRKPPTGTEAGWIVVNGTNPERQAGLFMKGFVPLQQYGFVDPQSVKGADGEVHPDPSYRVWSKILRTPGGPEEFPVDQIVSYRWYDPDICPVPGVQFPQLDGYRIQKLYCPECETVYFHKSTHLGRHLRVNHAYDRADIATYGQEAGISFSKEVTGGRQAVEEVVYVAASAPAPEAAAAELEPDVEIEEIRGRRPGRPRKEIGENV